MARLLLIVAAALFHLSAVAVTPAAAAEIDSALAAAFAEHSLPVPARGQVIICHGFGCKFRTHVVLSGSDRQQLAGLFNKARTTADAERAAVAAAVAWFSRRFGPIAGIERHVARAGMSWSGDRGQVDCVDSSLNTTSVLLTLDELKHLRHHSVDGLKSRGLGIDGRQLHTTAVLREANGGRQWAVDSWTRAAGQPPEVMPLDRWVGLD